VQMYLLRKVIEDKVRNDMGLTDDDVFFASLSSRTVVYKGQLTPAQVCAALLPSLDCFLPHVSDQVKRLSWQLA
jgi:hypothetical protein